MRNPITSTGVLKLRWMLPENWTASPPEMRLGIRNFCETAIECEVTPPEGAQLPATSYLYLEIRADDRACPIVVTVPLRNKQSFNFPRLELDSESRGWFHRSGLIRGINAVSGR